MTDEIQTLDFSALLPVRHKFKDADGLSYQTRAVSVSLPERASTVTMHSASRMPRPFASRVGKKRICSIDLPYEPADIERVQLHTLAWGGGPGDVKDYFTLNRQFYEVADHGSHTLLYRVTPVATHRTQRSSAAVAHRRALDRDDPARSGSCG